ncbi:hypothetical protein QBC43DRAFT_374449 [Cladorrhinum sp. PSN259]|nr:hypothetical protein QBC43DRAFT_374449 [Cladorrhinum sp. PSN259]
MAEMDIETDLDNVLAKVAEDGSMDYSCWPGLLPQVVAQIEKIANTEFPIPKLNSPPPIPPFPSSEPTQDVSSSQETNKENEVAPPVVPSSTTTGEPTVAAAGTLPKPIADMLEEILSVLQTNFTENPPHTIQRLAELVLRPKQHYRNVVPWLHALDRVVHVTSGANIYPLPPAIPDMSAMSLLANGAGGGGSSVINTTTISSGGILVGSDEALGGALLTPIPWLTRNGGEGGSSDAGSDAGSSSPLSASGSLSSHPQQHLQQQQRQQQQQQAHQFDGRVRTESTETIEGPNGMGRIETVSISVNGIPSTGAGGVGGVLAQRGITQGELLRQEQRAGVVPMSQLARQQQQAQIQAQQQANGTASGEDEDSPMDEEEEERPHARGPEEIGAADTGPQPAGAGTFMVGTAGDGHVEVHGINVEAAVGRPPDQTAAVEAGQQQLQRQLVTREANNTNNTDKIEEVIPRSPKREATEDLEGRSASKRVKEDETPSAEEAAEAEAQKAEEKPKLDAEGDLVLEDSPPAPEKTRDEEAAAKDHPISSDREKIKTREEEAKEEDGGEKKEGGNEQENKSNKTKTEEEI